MTPPKVLVVAGSARRQALSRRLARAARDSIDANAGRATLVELADFELPLYHADLESAEGIPAAAQGLQQLIAAHAALMIATPEYNGSMPPLLLNALTWCSRTDPRNPIASGLAIFAGKPAALLGSSRGALGGVRSLAHLRDLLGYLGMLVIAQQLAVPRAHQAFGDDGRLLDERQRGQLDTLSAALVRTAARLS